MCSGLAANSESGTWCARNVPSTCQPIDDLRPSPSFGSPEERSSAKPAAPRNLASRPELDHLDLRQDAVKRRRQELMHRRRLIPFDEIRTVAVSR